MPLCVSHLYEAWKSARDLAERRGDRDPVTLVGYDSRPQERPTAITGWIYYLRIDGHIKIGYASDLGKRLKAYPPTAELLAAHRGTRDGEQAIHRQMWAHLAHGREWYHPRYDVLDHIAKMKARYGEARDPRNNRPSGPSKAPSRGPVRTSKRVRHIS